MAEWFVYQLEAQPLGPLTTEAVVEAIFSGRIASDALIGAPGGSRWTRAIDVPVVARLLDGLPTRRRDSGMRMTETLVDAPITERDAPAPPPAPSSSSPSPPTIKRRSA